MDLEPYALTHAESASAASTASPNDKGKGKAAEEGGSGVDARPAEELPTIEQDVKQLVQGVSSWWTGFSQKSQAQFTQAQQHIASQGGIVSYAKKEASRLEAQLEETRRKAKEKREAEEEEERKRRAEEDEKTQEKEDSQTQAGSRAGPSGDAKVEEGETGESLFDADEATNASGTATGTAAPRQAAASTSSASPFAMDNNLISRLQTLSTDPRVASIQQDLSSRLSSSFNLLSTTFAPAASNASSGSKEAGTSTGNTATASLSSTLQDISSTLSKLSGPEAKAYAQKYLKASEELVGKMGEEVRVVVGDLVKVVPPPEAEGKSNPSTATTGTPAALAAPEKPKQDRQPSESSSEFSSWDLTDKSDKAEEAASGVSTGTATPSAFSSVSADQPATSAAAPTEVAKASVGSEKEVTATLASASSESAPAKKEEEAAEDSGEDSDWD